jgi:hypothetical protein
MAVLTGALSGFGVPAQRQVLLKNAASGVSSRAGLDPSGQRLLRGGRTQLVLLSGGMSES